MIRRREPQGLWLITQQDHALLSGELARHIGNAQFLRPEPYELTLTGIAQHDCGWFLHDDRPILSHARLPLDVFETPRQVSHQVWLESARRAENIDPYVGLLVCLHVLGLSALTVSANQPARFDVQQLRQQFDLNKFQHAIIERLERLRGTLGFQIDKPLRLGLGDGWTDPKEQQLAHGFRYLQAMDQLSLAICCTTAPENMTTPLHTRPGSPTLKLQLHRPDSRTLLVKPWPFDQPSLRFTIPYRPVPDRIYLSDDELHAVYAAAPIETFEIEVKSA
jgi:hypothetical protein